MTKILHLLKSINANTNNEKRRKYVLFHLKYKSLRTIVFIYINTLLLMLQLNLRVLESVGLMEGQGPHSHQWEDA